MQVLKQLLNIEASLELIYFHFFFFDDVGRNGSESNLLECSPHHNCGSSKSITLQENAGVQCSRKGIISFMIVLVLKLVFKKMSL